MSFPVATSLILPTHVVRTILSFGRCFWTLHVFDGSVCNKYLKEYFCMVFFLASFAFSHMVVDASFVSNDFDIQSSADLWNTFPSYLCLLLVFLA